MLKKLKHKFILITMIMVSVILAIVMVSICGLAYRIGKNQIILELGNTSMSLMSSEEIPKENSPSKADNPFTNTFFSISTITVIFNQNMEITEVYSNELPSSLTDTINTAVYAILEEEESQGIIFENYLLYRITRGQYKTAISFTSLDSLLNRIAIAIYASLISIIGCLVLFFILSSALSGVAMKPVEAAWEREKQFVQDASHDLKTPLTVILANTEIIKSHGDKKVSEIDAWLDSTKEEAERMRRLVDSMLELATSESVTQKIHLQDTNISEICEKTVLQMEPVAFEKNIIIESDISKKIFLKSDADYFTRLAYILVDNAIKYAPGGSRIFVKLKKSRREIKFSVKNENSYIQPEQMPHLFERFWRSDKARSTGSFGLGLAIAKNICENLGGKITVNSSKDTGTEFTVTFSLMSKIL